MHDKRFPGETPAYRSARDELLVAERDLRARVEAVAALRRAVGANESYALGWFNLGVVLSKMGPLHLPAAQGSLGRAFTLAPALRDRQRVPTLDSRTYRSGLDLGRPLPPTWNFAESQKQAPAKTAGLAAILEAVTGSTWPGTVLAAGAVISIFSVTLVVLYGQTRILFAMSRDGMLPELFHKVNPRTLTPVPNTVIVAVVIAILVLIAGDQFNVLSNLQGVPSIPVDGSLLTASGLITLAVVVLVPLLGAILGGKAGMRFHRKVDQVGIDHRSGHTSH